LSRLRFNLNHGRAVTESSETNMATLVFVGMGQKWKFYIILIKTVYVYVSLNIKIVLQSTESKCCSKITKETIACLGFSIPPFRLSALLFSSFWYKIYNIQKKTLFSHYEITLVQLVAFFFFYPPSIACILIILKINQHFFFDFCSQ
jgi:hypothetical protein